MKNGSREVRNCRAVRCPFESICRNSDFYTDRSGGCDTQRFIISEAKMLMQNEITPVTPGAVISESGMSKIQKVKQLRQETGVSLRTAKDALDYSGWDIDGAKSYIEFGWYDKCLEELHGLPL